MTISRPTRLDGATWLKYSISIWSDIVKTNEERKINHPAIFPKEIPKRLIQIFTLDKQALVLDPFMGVGSTLLAAQELQRKAIGFEISEKYALIAKNRIYTIFGHENCEIYIEDARNIDNYIKPESVDLCITSPPYWNILSEKRTADNKATRNYIHNENSLSSISEYTTFLNELENVFIKVFRVLKKKSYCILITMDIRKKENFYPFHVDTILFMKRIGYALEDIIIWDRSKEYNRLRPLGYPFMFRVNKVHEYITIFRKL